MVGDQRQATLRLKRQRSIVIIVLIIDHSRLPCLLGADTLDLEVSQLSVATPLATTRSIEVPDDPATAGL